MQDAGPTRPTPKLPRSHWCGWAAVHPEPCSLHLCESAGAHDIVLGLCGERAK